MVFFIEYNMPTDRRMRDDLRELESRLHATGDTTDSRNYLADASFSVCKTGDTFVLSLLGTFAKSPVCFTVTAPDWKDLMVACRWVLCDNFKVDDTELPF